MNDKRRFLAASLLGGALGPTAFAADPPARPKAEGGGPGLLTVNGQLGRSNRGPLDPALDQLMSKHGLVTTFNDACGAINGAMPKLEKIEGSLSEIQAREVMVDFAFMNLSLKQRPRFYTECDVGNETITEKAVMPDPFELGELNFSLRGRLLRDSFGESVKQIRVAGKTQQEIEQAIDGGRFSVLVDETGTFIKQSFTPDSR